MIIWLASYPKSGNTWVRSLLSAYYYSKNGNFNFELLKNIDVYPQQKYFDVKIDKPGEINSYWDISQEKIISKKKIKILKTHNSLLELNGKNFTKPQYTLGTVYIVRDPRNVITSLKNHYDLDYEQSLDFMLNEKKYIYNASGKKDYAIRKGKWKLITNISWSGDDNNKAAIGSDFQLFDLDVDPYETSDLYYKQPDISKELLELLKKTINQDNSK